MIIFALIELSVALDCYACFANVAQGENCSIQESSSITCPDEMICYYETINSSVETWERESIVEWRGCRMRQRRDEVCENKVGIVQGNIIRTESCVWTCESDFCTPENIFQFSSTSTEPNLKTNVKQNDSNKTIISVFLSFFVVISTLSFAYILYLKLSCSNRQISP